VKHVKAVRRAGATVVVEHKLPNDVLQPPQVVALTAHQTALTVTIR